MKTSRLFRIFIMAVDTLVLLLLRLVRPFTRLIPGRQPAAEDAQTPPHATRHTRPDQLGILPELEVDGAPAEAYQRSQPVYFDPDAAYAAHEGVVTFRGDNLRSGAAYGALPGLPARLEIAWSVDTGKLKKGYGTGYWTGSGWTGQPLLVRWTDEQKRAMPALYADKQAQDGLVEAIYSTMDGNVYFIDIADGSPTRDVLQVGLPFKGAGALHPTLPVLFLGPGDSGANPGEDARAYVYSLTDNRQLLTYGMLDPFALRKFHGYDSSPLVHAQTDTVIQPGENGILYTFRLGTHFDANTGEVTVHPQERVKLRYRTARSGEQSYWLGMEDSSVVWKNYLYIADNGGTLLCIDLNTMQVVWAQDVADDTNGSPVFALEDGVPVLYIATSLHWKASRLLKLGDVPIFKINAVTGEYIWRRTYLCNTVAGISGGVQATCVVGRGNISDLVVFPVARTPHVRSGILVALDRRTGKEVWKRKLHRYAWSSPVAVYDEAGNAVLVQGDAGGRLMLLDARTGALLHTIELGANIEASPAVFGDTLVVGTRGMKIFGVRLV